MTHRRIIAIVAAAITMAVLILFLSRRDKAPAVSVARAVTGEIVSYISATGNVRPVTQVNVSTDVAGRIIAMLIAEGDTVDSGQVLLQVDSATYRAQVDEARANLDLARAGLRQSTAAFRRVRALFKGQLISRQELEAAQAQFELDLAKVNQAQAALKQALDQLTETRIVAPLRGVVTRLNVEFGEVVITGTVNVPGSVLMVIADLSQMEVECSVDETDVPKVKHGQSAQITIDALPQRIFRGVVTEVGNAAQVQEQAAAGQLTQGTAGSTTAQNATIDYTVVVRIEDSLSLLKPDMTADVQIRTARKSNALIVPVQSVVTRGPQPNDAQNGNGGSGAQRGAREMTVVFTIDNGVARMHVVETGLSGEETIELTSGVQPGQMVITGPFSVLRTLKDGDKVKLREE